MTRRARRIGLSTGTALLLLLAAPAWRPALGADGPAPAVDPKVFKALKFRGIGPYRGGRVTAVTGVPGESGLFYMGSTGGGVWKTSDAGVTWRNVSDKHFTSASIGAVAVAPSDHNIVYAGTGSACIRGNTSPGDGVYRSTDAGESWKRVGLEETGQIGRIQVHPSDPDRVWVAALGHAFGPNPQRGVFRSTDGGATWRKVLDGGDSAGAVDLAIDPSNARILFAAMWRAERKPWTMTSGGEGSGLFRSDDGGETWKEVTDGLPKGMKGRIGVSISGANPKRIWALVEADDGGLFRSDDGGKKFRLINADRNFRQRAWYYTHVHADPKDASTIYVLNTGLWRSDDGGKEFQFIRAPHGDHHDLWIDPDDPQILINGNDGGANVSHNGGKSWSSQANQPTAEMYRVSVDARFPYRVYGCQQDNSCVSLPSRTADSSIDRQDWYVIGGCESGHVAIDPRKPDVTYSGCYGGTIGRYDHTTGQEREIMAWPQVAVGQSARDLKYRFQWNAPILISPHDPDVLYHTSQFVHRTVNEGQSWEIISPDLTRNDKAKQDYAGGPVTLDNTGVEVYGTIFAFAESPHERGMLWAGSDDGLAHVSRDAGKSWTNVTPKRMPEWGQVNSIEISPHARGRVFLAVTRYKIDDFRPYIFRTDDGGATWSLLTDGRNGIPAGHFVRVVREDPDRKGLLYAGTEFGLYVSFDDGRRWQAFQQELPVSPVTDLAVTQKDLVAATQGRSFWILDDLTVLHQIDDAVAAAGTHLFPPRDAVRFGGGSSFGGGGAAGQNPPSGVLIHYLLSKAPGEKEEIAIEILDSRDDVIRSFSSLKEEKSAPNPFARFLPPDALPSRKLPAEEGLNRFVWDFRLPDAEMEPDTVLWGVGRGPRVPPGVYRVRLTRGEVSQTREARVLKDPRLTVSDADLQAQFDLARRIWSSLSQSHGAWKRIREIRTQVEDLTRRLKEAGRGEGLEEAAQAVKAKLAPIEAAIHQTRNESSQDALNFPPMLDNQLIGLMSVVESADARPTDGSHERYAGLRAQLDSLQAELRAVIAAELDTFNDLVRSRNMPPVIVPPAE